MNADIKAKWVAALRSGKYEQGQQKLRSLDNKFCCLGVLCDLIAPEGWEVNSRNCYEQNGWAGTLPSDIERAAAINGATHIGRLIDMNDDGKSFAEIADYIERAL